MRTHVQTCRADRVAAVRRCGGRQSDFPQRVSRPPGQPTNWERFYYYPYVYYPHNFQTYPESYDDLYHRYPIQKQIPVYNAGWHNFYLMDRPYHSGHHYILDIF